MTRRVQTRERGAAGPMASPAPAGGMILKRIEPDALLVSEKAVGPFRFVRTTGEPDESLQHVSPELITRSVRARTAASGADLARVLTCAAAMRAQGAVEDLLECSAAVLFGADSRGGKPRSGAAPRPPSAATSPRAHSNCTVSADPQRQGLLNGHRIAQLCAQYLAHTHDRLQEHNR